MRQYGSFGGLERSSLSSTGTCTLLGPEGSAPMPLRVSGSVPRTSAEPVTGMRECRPYVENYTVDASIFDSSRRDRLRVVVLRCDQKMMIRPAFELVGPLVMSGASSLRVSGV
jgi:hypothetical protein